MLQPGKYQAKPIDAQLATAKTGTEQVGVKFELLDPYALGETVVWYGYFTDKTWQRSIESLRYCGWKGDDLSDLTSIYHEDNKSTVELVIEHEVGNDGQTRARVKWVNRGGGATVTNPMNNNEAKSFAARMKAKVATVNAAMGGAGKAAAPAKQATSRIEDEIPF